MALDQIVQGQGSQEAKANALFSALAPAGLFGVKDSATSGLALGLYGGRVMINGAMTSVADQNLTLSASVTSYIEASPITGTVTKNTTGFTPGYWPLYTAVTGTATITTLTDYRMAQLPVTGLLQKAFPSDANYTATQAEAANDIIHITAGVITTTRDFILPVAFPKVWIVYNATAQSVRFIGASGTGIIVATTKRATIYADGTNIVRLTADT